MISLIVVFLLSYLLSSWLSSTKSPLKILDLPNERSLHETPTPKVGGLAILTSLLVGWALISPGFEIPAPLVAILVAALLVAGVSFVDDLLDISPLVRIITHATSAAILIYFDFSIDDSLIGKLFTFVSVIWMLNLYNFMDGMDGFAGGMTCSGFGFIGLAAFIQGDHLFALLSWVVAVASAGFLTKNFPPAQIFMGDVGSATLGFLAAAFSLWGIRKGVFEIWFPLLVFSPFVLDATITLIRRILCGERFWLAHCTHYYQRLAKSGCGHEKTVLAEYIMMVSVGLIALLALRANSAWASIMAIMFLGVVYITIIILIHRMESKAANK